LWILAGCLALGVVAALPVVSGRTTPRWGQLNAAKLALDEARRTGAEAWSPEIIRRGEHTLRRGQFEHRRQELRFVLFRDFTEAELILRDAERGCLLAAREAVEKRDRARLASQEAITRAAQSVNKGDAFAQAMHLGAYDRTLLSKSKIHLTEAKLLHREGAYSLASSRAQTAELQAERVSGRAAGAASRYSDAGLIRSWRNWIDQTISWSRRTRQPAIVVYKDKHLLALYVGGKPTHSYAAELGYNSVGNKTRSGDAATPEGRYFITAKKGLGASTYHKALLLNYPNEDDRRRFAAARRAGRLPRGTNPGGLIEIHGEGGRGKDWTKGCVALSNRDIDDLFDRVSTGTPVTIVGGDGNGGHFTKLIDLHRMGSEPGLD
jgi:hypothetical protein